MSLLSNDGRDAHLGDAVFYRGDRRRVPAAVDPCGYLVVRVLAEDVNKDLDGVHDAIVRASTLGRRRLDGSS